jgi:hypothetical protein
VELSGGRYSVYRKSDGARVQTSNLEQFWANAVIDGGDYGIIDNNIQAQGAPFPTGGAASGLTEATAVPEPALGAGAGIGMAMLLRRRRRGAGNRPFIVAELRAEVTLL